MLLLALHFSRDVVRIRGTGRNNHTTCFSQRRLEEVKVSRINHMVMKRAEGFCLRGLRQKGDRIAVQFSEYEG